MVSGDVVLDVMGDAVIVPGVESKFWDVSRSTRMGDRPNFVAANYFMDEFQLIVSSSKVVQNKSERIKGKYSNEKNQAFSAIILPTEQIHCLPSLQPCLMLCTILVVPGCWYYTCTLQYLLQGTCMYTYQYANIMLCRSIMESLNSP